MKKALLFLASFILAASSLSCAPGLYEYHSVAPEEYHEHYREIPLYVDDRMSKDGRQSLADAINEWNFALNRSLSIDVKSWAFDPTTSAGTAMMDAVKTTHQGIIVMWVEHDDPILEQMHADNSALAFVNGLGRQANILVIVEDRIGNRNLKAIDLHELGHALGCLHVNTYSLMYPYADGGNQASCIDKITIAQVAQYNGLDIKTLNYCSTPNFE